MQQRFWRSMTIASPIPTQDARSQTGRYDWLIFIAALAAAMAGVLAITPEILEYPKTAPRDFPYFWAAGTFWWHFESPYQPAYQAFLASQDLVYINDAPRPFFYPPNAIWLYLPLGPFGDATAWRILSTINFTALLVSSYLFARIGRHIGVFKQIAVPALLHIALITLVWSDGVRLYSDAQPSQVIYCGALLAMLGAWKRQAALIIIGLTITLIKPQLGAPLLLAFLLLPQTRLAALCAGAVTAALSLIGLSQGNPLEIAHMFVENIAQYTSFNENRANRLSGLGYIYHITLGGLASPLILLVMTFSSIIIGKFLISRSQREISREAMMTFALFALIAAFFFTPSHNNHYLPVTAAIVWLWRTPGASAIIASVAYGLIMVSPDIAMIIDRTTDPYERVAAIDTAAITILFVVLVSKLANRNSIQALRTLFRRKLRPIFEN